ncbi:MAG: ATP-binding protein [Candidatus Sericytochromatia bacterium]
MLQITPCVRKWARCALLPFLFCLLAFLAGPVWAEDIPTRVLTPADIQRPFALKGLWALTGPEGQNWQTQVPGRWEQHYPRRPLTHFGTGVYRLRLRFPPAALGAYFKLYTSLVGADHLRCYANEQLVAQNGFVSDSSSRVLQFMPFRVEQPQMTLRCEVRNHTLYSSGLIRPVLVGPALQIENLQFTSKMVFNLMIGVFLFLGVFYLLLYVGNRQDKALLAFALLCLSLGLFGEFYHVRNLEYLWGDIPVDVSARLTRLALFGIVPSFFWYAFWAAPQSGKSRYLSLRFVRGMSWVNLIFALPLLWPSAWYAPMLGPWALLMAACLLYHLWPLRIFVRQPKAWPFLFSALVFTLTLLNDMLNGAGLLHNGNFARYGLLLFCLVQAGFLSLRMQHNYRKALRLQHELQEVNQNLDQLVSTRTQEVQSQNQQLQQLVRFKDEMTRMMVHDLKTPLSTLLSLPVQQTSLSESHRSSLQAASQRMLSLIENMLRVKHTERAQLEVSLRACAVHTLVEQALLTVAPWAQSKKIMLQQHIPESVCLKLDAALFERVLLNLLDNAVKQTPIGGQITVRCETAAQEVRLLLEDTGSGMSAPQMARAFEPEISFAQPQAPRSSGLGLAFCRQVIRAHGGEMALENTPQGGLRVVMALPPALSVDAPKSWQPEHLAALRPLAVRLSHLEVFEVSQIQQALQHAPAGADAKIQAWLSALEYAVREVNEQAYAELIAQVSPPAGG